MSFRSHPDKLLIDHLREVGEGAENLVPSDLKTASYIAGSHHDLGKYTAQFQTHLKTGKAVRCSSHASISALFAFNTAIENNLDPLTSVLVMTAVKSHHGRLQGLTSISKWLDTLRYQEDTCIREQYEQVRRNGTETRSLKFPPNLDMDLDQVIERARRAVRDARLRDNAWRNYFLGTLIFSSLIDADKHSASGNEFTETTPLHLEEVYRFHDNLPGNKMKDLRDALFEAVRKWDARGEVVGIISPTGTGKTLAGILAAVRDGRRVIYSLPFISIVEQTFDVASTIFPDRVLKFHHMAYPDEDDENKSPEDLLLMVESWDYPMVVTTFESLLSTFLSYKNVNLKRLHSLYGSVVILDEVQAIPAHKWYVVKEALDEISKALDIHFILMSATVPRLLTPREVIDPLKGGNPTGSGWALRIELSPRRS
ncbi:CRISPR-associated endonuclease Cas3'' [Metallosphaera hakonensis]|uniref:CRISPR-associated endonuclease Cas3'' n=1 Tax=Metallosphaera hakonensis TaxID=79601 RepID=UPI0006D0DEA8|nr:CRISPR-associated endonuclease Cas3'' [Metallosphaera hakonensis]